MELVNLRASVSAAATPLTLPQASVNAAAASRAELYGIDEAVTVVQRDMIVPGTLYRGPMLITEQVSTTWVIPGWQVQRDSIGNLLLSKT